MTPVDPTQPSEDANLRQIVAQLHVNLGHPSNDASARAIRLSGGSDESIQAALKGGCTVCEHLTVPSPVPAASLRRWTEFGRCVALDLSMFADITGQNGLFFKHVGRGQTLPGYLSGCRQESSNSFSIDSFLVGLTLSVPKCLRFDLGGEFLSSFSELAEQIGLSAAAEPPTQNAPCERAGRAWKHLARSFQSSETILQQNCGFVQCRIGQRTQQ